MKVAQPGAWSLELGYAGTPWFPGGYHGTAEALRWRSVCEVNVLCELSMQKGALFQGAGVLTWNEQGHWHRIQLPFGHSRVARLPKSRFLRGAVCLLQLPCRFPDQLLTNRM